MSTDSHFTSGVVIGGWSSMGPLEGPKITELAGMGRGPFCGMLLAFGKVCALLSAARTVKGQVVDAAMIDGANGMMAVFHGLETPGWHDDSAPGKAVLAGAARFYNTYETADGKFISIAALEPQFYDALIEKLDLDRETLAGADFSAGISAAGRRHEIREMLASIFATRTRDEWCELWEGTDVCFAPVLSMPEAIDHGHSQARRSFIQVGDVVQPAPAPRFSSTPPDAPRPRGEGRVEILEEIGYSAGEIENLVKTGAVVP